MKIRFLDENRAPPAKVTGVDDTTIPPACFVYPINYFHATCFKTVDVYMKNKNVSANDMLYAYRAYFEMLLLHSRASKQDQLQMSMYYQDRDPMEDVSGDLAKTDRAPAASKNTGPMSRFMRSQFGRPFETIGCITARYSPKTNFLWETWTPP